MAILVNASEIKKAFAARPLFDSISFSIESGDRIGLIGPNGAGKSTLLRILASQTQIDQGNLVFQRGLKVAFLEQVPVFQPQATVLSTILEGTGNPHDWESIAKAEEILSKLSFKSGEIPIETLSGGWKKRAALGREWAKNPDLLLLDEPTNHLDVEGILWLEEFLAHAEFATLTITHDRLFLQRISNQIYELDRRNPNGLLVVKGSYTEYLEIKDQMISAQERRETVLKNTLRRETEWLRQGAKARTTKQQARIQRAENLKDEVSELSFRNQNKTAKLDFQSSDKNPKKLIDAKGISKSFGSKNIFSNFDLLVTPGKRIGFLGQNGCGKSTLIRVLLGLEEPDTGSVVQSDHLSVAYFEQNRETLDPTQTVAKTLCPFGDHVDYGGRKIHIRSYLDRFLFTQGQMDMAVGKLSGGEQSRLLIARLMLQEANLLVLDEPTNDLDMATLNVLEECLMEFPGALLLVTHDRYFLAQVATQILAFGQDSTIQSFADLDQWETWHSNQNSNTQPSSKKQTAQAVSPSVPKKKKLSFNEQREWEMMEGLIQKTEAALSKLEVEIGLPENATRILEITKEMSRLQAEIEKLYSRWSELEAKQ